MPRLWARSPVGNTMEYYAVERKKELLSFATAWMELESIMLSEASQAVKGKYHSSHLLAEPNLKKRRRSSKQNITKDIEIKNKLTVTGGEKRGNFR